MLKFNNNHIFTGYLKQLLSSVNLPTYRIYTKEHRKYLEKYGEESPEIIETVPQTSIMYKEHTRYIPYIRNGEIMEYVYTEDSSSTNASNVSGTTKWKVVDNYYDNKKPLNNTRRFRITNNIYDTYTHEYLGDYLRFLRDYKELDLMPLYNCFSNKLCHTLFINCQDKITNSTSSSHFIFNTNDSHYKIYMVPVKLFKEYTIAIDCSTPVEMCCGIYGKYQDVTTDTTNNLPHDTYKHYSNLRFNSPIVYSPLKEIYSFVSKDSLVELANKERDLKLFIKLPAHNTSSITILEGNYLGYNDRFTYRDKTTKNLVTCQNHTVTNLWDEDTNNIITLDKYLETREFKPITFLQLLAYNTKVSYPFADRLIEYLTGNVITHLDDVEDNILRTQTVVAAATNNKITYEDGIWDDRMRPLLYEYMYNLSSGINKTSATTFFQEDNHDMFGYVDKETEQLFSALISTDGTTASTIASIANVDIYPDLYISNKQKINSNNYRGK